MMRLIIISCLLALVRGQEVATVDEDEANNLWGAVPTGPEVVTVESTTPEKPVEEATTKPCKCVPYNLCNSTYFGVDVHNPAKSGSGRLDMRGGADDVACPLPGEVCCDIPTPKKTPGPRKEECGFRNREGIGANNAGASTKFGEFPWVVALFNAQDREYVGAGVLIRPLVVMTTAHIASKYVTTGLRARAGDWDLRNNDEEYYPEERLVKEIYIHEQFNNKSFANNIALLLLPHPINLTEHINVICLDANRNPYRDECIANGWGKDKFGPQGRLSPILKKVDLTLVESDKCTKALQKTRLGPNYTLHDSFVCAVGKDGADTCEGDGGAPLVCNIAINSYKLVGLVSYGVGCGQKDLPAVYTNVSLFLTWLNEQMKKWGIDVDDTINQW